MNPSTKEDFEELSKLIVGKLSNYQVRFSIRKKEKRRLSYCDVLKIIYFVKQGFYEFQVQTYSNNKINVFCIIIFSFTSVRISVTNSFFYYFVVFQSSAEYVPFLETLFRDLCVSCKYINSGFVVVDGLVSFV